MNLLCVCVHHSLSMSARELDSTLLTQPPDELTFPAHQLCATSANTTDFFSHNVTNSPPWLIKSDIDQLPSSTPNFYCLHKFTSSKQYLNLDTGRGLVSISAAFSSVLTFTTFTSPFSISSRIKCSFTSICFVLSWKT